MAALVVAVLIFILCVMDLNKPSSTQSESAPAADELPTVELFGQTWTYYAPNVSLAWKFEKFKEGADYRTDDSHRLLAFTGDGPHRTSLVFIAWTEKRNRNDWVRDGAMIEKFHDGRTARTQYRNGLIHGTYQEWHPNGQLSFEYEYAFGELVGDVQDELPDAVKE